MGTLSLFIPYCVYIFVNKNWIILCAFNDTKTVYICVFSCSLIKTIKFMWIFSHFCFCVPWISFHGIIWINMGHPFHDWNKSYSCQKYIHDAKLFIICVTKNINLFAVVSKIKFSFDLFYIQLKGIFFFRWQSFKIMNSLVKFSAISINGNKIHLCNTKFYFSCWSSEFIFLFTFHQ